MRSRRNFATPSLAGSIVALMLATGAAPSLSPIGRNVANSYHSAVRVYDRARMWGAIAWWWVDPPSVPAERDGRTDSQLEDVCQARPAAGRAR